MALKATIYKATVNVADLDRNQFLDASLTLARHPSETQERMMLRLLAWLKYADERLQFTRGLCADDEPEAWLRNDHLGIDLWIELGLPDERRIKKACTQAAEVALAREDASPCLRLGAFEIRRYQSQLWWIKSVAGQSETIVPWQTWLQPLELPAGLGSVQLTAGGDIRPPRADEAVSVRFKAPGLLHIVGRNGGRKLKKIWQELGVPPWLRDTTPLLFYGETLIAAAGVFVTQEGVAVGENGVSFVWQKTLSQVKAG